MWRSAGATHDRGGDRPTASAVGKQALVEQVEVTMPAPASNNAAVQRKAAPDDVAPAEPGDAAAGSDIAAPAGGIDLPGFIDTSDGANLRTGPAEAGGKTVIDAPLP